MTRCVDCQHFNLRADQGMAAVGFGKCQFDPMGKFTGATRGSCARFQQAESEAVARRLEWLGKRGMV